MSRDMSRDAKNAVGTAFFDEDYMEFGRYSGSFHTGYEIDLNRYEVIGLTGSLCLNFCCGNQVPEKFILHNTERRAGSLHEWFRC